MRRPLPAAAFKVGESTIEVGAYYYHGKLQLYDHLESEHLEKLGLRYFYGGGSTSVAERSEFGVRRFLPAKSYQIDRGVLENHLRDVVSAAGCDLREGTRVCDVQFGAGEARHVVAFTDEDGNARSARGRWVIDAMGRAVLRGGAYTASCG
jgi:flavin-dependent dehydrogenase